MGHDDARHIARQLWNLPSSTSAFQPHCTPITLPSNGVLQLADSVITLTTDVVFQPECTSAINGDVVSVAHLRDPFYASTIPMVYVIAATTVIAWVLVVMLTIASRTSYLGGPQAAPAFSNGHGIIGGANGGNSGLSGAGSRPWLQKVAALAVAISLTIATADTLEVVQRQYGSGIMDAPALRREVLGSTEIRVTRVVSDVFLWLAQVQTLVRLFPRHKEKVMIKWIGFVLITFDSIFSCLNSFLVNGEAKGRNFVDAIPALSYLFELALGLLYAAWVIYYSLTKRRYAYYHRKMRNISLIALLSLVSVLTPVVFFITDVSNQDVAGWGDYFRWVGAAAASVVVWEWVERIEALESDDKKDGILGREVFDGDEMLDVVPSSGEEAAWTQGRNLRRNFIRHRRDDDAHGGGNTTSMMESGFGHMAQRFRSKHQQSPQHYPLGRAHTGFALANDDQGQSASHTSNDNEQSTTLGGPTPPAPVASPINRGDTTSAGSTVYVVRYHPQADIPQPIRRRAATHRSSNTKQSRLNANVEKAFVHVDEDQDGKRLHGNNRWHPVSNPFKRKRTSPPQEIQRARAEAASAQRTTTPAHNFPKWDLKNRLGVLAAETGDRIRDRNAAGMQQAEPPTVTVIPAQPRGARHWTPPAMSEGDVSTTQTPGVHTVTSSSPWAFPATNLVADRRADAAARNTAGTMSQTRASPPVLQLSRTGPPRADDISPVAARNNRTVIVPAPQRRSPSDRSALRNDSPATPDAGDVHRNR